MLLNVGLILIPYSRQHIYIVKWPFNTILTYLYYKICLMVLVASIGHEVYALLLSNTLFVFHWKPVSYRRTIVELKSCPSLDNQTVSVILNFQLSFSCYITISEIIILYVQVLSSRLILHLNLNWVPEKLYIIYKSLCRNGLIFRLVDPYQTQSKRTLHLVQLPAWCIQPQAWHTHSSHLCFMDIFNLSYYPYISVFVQ